jgi:hypothetical protein
MLFFPPWHFISAKYCFFVTHRKFLLG